VLAAGLAFYRKKCEFLTREMTSETARAKQLNHGMVQPFGITESGVYQFHSSNLWCLTLARYVKGAARPNAKPASPQALFFSPNPRRL
jgi:hypothetical protein